MVRSIQAARSIYPRRLWQHQNGLGANHTKKTATCKVDLC